MITTSGDDRDVDPYDQEEALLNDFRVDDTTDPPLSVDVDVEDDEIEFDDIFLKREPGQLYRDALAAHVSGNLNTPLFSAEEEFDCAVRVIKGDRAAKLRMFNANLRLVVAVASRYVSSMGSATALEDLIAEGNIGLLKAVEKFDPHLGYRFTTYAKYWIEHYVRRYLSMHARLVRWPTHIAQLHARYMRLKLEAEGRDKPLHDADVMSVLKITAQQLKKLKSLRNETFSGDDPINHGTESAHTFFDNYVDENSEINTERLGKKNLTDQLFDLFASQLTHQEADVLRRRYGLGMESQTLSDISKAIKVRPERVKQLEARALRKLQRALRFNGVFLTDFLI